MQSYYSVHQYTRRKKPFTKEVEVKYRPFVPKPNKYNPQTCKRTKEAEKAKKRASL